MKFHSRILYRGFSTSLQLAKHYRPAWSEMKPPGTISVTVLGTGHNRGPKSLLLDTGMTRYLVAFALTRVFLYRSKAARIQHAFFTQMSWDYVSGLLGESYQGLSDVSGVALTARTAGVKKLTVHGPPKVEELMQLTRHFADCETTDIGEYLRFVFCLCYFMTRLLALLLPVCSLPVCSEILSKPFIDNAFRVRAFPVSLGTLDTTNILEPDYKRVKFDDDASKKGVTTYAYYFQTLQPRFKLDKEKCLALGIPRFTKQMADHSPLKKLPESQLPGPDVLKHSVHHLVVDGSGCIPPVRGIYSQSTILHHFFDARVYPLLHDVQSANRKKAITEATQHRPSPFDSVVYAQPQMQYCLRPWAGFQTPEFENLDETRLLDEAFDPLYVTREEAETQFATMRSTLNEHFPSVSGLSSSGPVSDRLHEQRNCTQTAFTQPYPELTFLGTASSSPSKYRNISCILIQLSPDDYLMLDCGEGSLNQLYALHGPTVAGDILRRLRLILVTHMHADHHGGIFSVALARARLLQLDNPGESPLLPILAPPAFARWMTSFCDLFSHGSIVSLFILPSVYISPCPTHLRPPLCPLRHDSSYAMEWKSLLDRLQLEIHPIKVPHTGTSWAYVLRGRQYKLPSEEVGEEESQTCWSLVYSGDTPECDDLVEAGRNCDLLIHEATMSDEHKDLADRARHSTLSSAIRTGESMMASFTLLNHFSQRYGRLPMLDTFRPSVATAFDFMKIRFDDLRRLPYYVPYYKYAFGKHWDTQQAKAEAYSWRKYREQHQERPEVAVVSKSDADSKQGKTVCN
ncbi:ribonuclease Z [Paragonimus westermani]|uniref:ribonuclease Z n=1 Tax=Paragonimus westermani TaxID=34504 RepID=A0A5J4NNE2_9TREM|nr:ribonuclease Z [Paragonimus westermani]